MTLISVNGEQREAPAPLSVATIVAELVADPSARGVAVALNGEVLPRAAWESTSLGDGDRVEVLTATQGG
ncbi:sulfur carrier protein ThiS [Natronosporangium hydrolyticum]|uniref:Sulfur carrier protein ThiS n=1 Tax=Natronosporangium hydrolyticum TaxID=2811111 RepID=A0A895YPP6_9ACTN|nr:sulfur carrier protein ThiS [Natronosporangium hydrolyticum]